MAACLWCKAEVHLGNAVCPSCGKRQVDHPSLPSLDLPSGPARASQRMVAEAPSSGGGGAMFDADDLLFPSDGPALETESDWQRPQKAVSVAPVAPVRPAGPRVAPPPEPVEVLAFAAYGAAPDAWWQAPGYLYRVKMRQA